MLHRKEHSPDIYANALVKVLQRQVRQRTRPVAQAGIVERRIQAAIRSQRLRQQTFDRHRIADVSLERDCVTTRRDDPFDDLTDLVSVSRRKNHARTRCGKRAGSK